MICGIGARMGQRLSAITVMCKWLFFLPSTHVFPLGWYVNELNEIKNSAAPIHIMIMNKIVRETIYGVHVNDDFVISNDVAAA